MKKCHLREECVCVYACDLTETEVLEKLSYWSFGSTKFTRVEFDMLLASLISLSERIIPHCDSAAIDSLRAIPSPCSHR